MFWNNYVKLCLQVGKSPNAVAKELSLSSGSVTSWKNDGRVPHHTTLIKIADYFGVTTDYLLGKETASDVKPNATILSAENVHMIPVYESVSAGFGATANDFIVDYMPLYFPHAHEASETLCITVQGDSMSPKIENGDIIQVHKQTSVDSGSIAVVLVDGEDALVKRIVYDEKSIELHSFNPEYETVRFEGADVLRVQIIGLVRKIIKNAETSIKQPEALHKDTVDERLAALADRLSDEDVKELTLLVDYIISKRKNNRPD